MDIQVSRLSKGISWKKPRVQSTVIVTTTITICTLCTIIEYVPLSKLINYVYKHFYYNQFLIDVINCIYLKQSKSQFLSF